MAGKMEDALTDKDYKKVGEDDLKGSTNGHEEMEVDGPAVAGEQESPMEIAEPETVGRKTGQEEDGSPPQAPRANQIQNNNEEDMPANGTQEQNSSHIKLKKLVGNIMNSHQSLEYVWQRVPQNGTPETKAFLLLREIGGIPHPIKMPRGSGFNSVAKELIDFINLPANMNETTEPNGLFRATTGDEKFIPVPTSCALHGRNLLAEEMDVLEWALQNSSASLSTAAVTLAEALSSANWYDRFRICDILANDSTRMALLPHFRVKGTPTPDPSPLTNIDNLMTYWRLGYVFDIPSGILPAVSKRIFEKVIKISKDWSFAGMHESHKQSGSSVDKDSSSDKASTSPESTRAEFHSGSSATFGSQEQRGHVTLKVLKRVINWHLIDKAKRLLIYFPPLMIDDPPSVRVVEDSEVYFSRLDHEMLFHEVLVCQTLLRMINRLRESGGTSSSLDRDKGYVDDILEATQPARIPHVRSLVDNYKRFMSEASPANYTERLFELSQQCGPEFRKPYMDFVDRKKPCPHSYRKVSMRELALQWLDDQNSKDVRSISLPTPKANAALFAIELFRQYPIRG